MIPVLGIEINSELNKPLIVFAPSGPAAGAAARLIGAETAPDHGQPPDAPALFVRLCPAFVFASGGVTAPYVPFRLVLLQDQPYLLIQESVDEDQPLRDILMHRAFADAEASCRGADRGFVGHDPLGQRTGSLFHIRLHDCHTTSLFSGW